MKITIGIITRNRAKELQRCLVSLTKQSKVPNRIVVVDNASDDNTKEVVLAFNKLPIKYIFENRVGVSYARNKLIETAKDDILAFIDDDCEAPRDWIKSILEAHKKHPKALVIQGWPESYPKESSISIITTFNFELGFKDRTYGKPVDYFNTHNFLKKDFKFLLVDTKNVSFKLKIFKEKNFRFNTKIYKGFDSDLARQIISKGEMIIFCPKIKVIHWERSTIKSFFEQRFILGRSISAVRSEWGDKEVYKRPYPFWLSRSFGFILYCKNKRLLHKLPVILPLYTMEKFALGLGFVYQSLLGKSSLSLPNRS